MKKNRRFSSFINMQHIFLFEVSIGIIANTFLLLFHILTFLLEHRLKSTDLVIGHLAFIHILMLLTVGFIAMDIFGFHDLGNGITCKYILYYYRVMRGLSISTTCLLSVIQAITLSPRSSCLAKFKQKSLHQNLCCFLFLWLFNMLICGRFLISTVATPNATLHSLMFVTQSCSLLPIRSFLKYISLSLMIFKHMSFIGLMALSSGYMLILLCRHKRKSKHLHSLYQPPKSSPEQRATWTILLLMSFFIVMYILDSVIEYTSAMLWNHGPILHGIQMLLGNGYATFSPFVLISTERRLIKWFIFMWGKHRNFLLFRDG
ncbi:vomeronasal type-1 receptor 90-like [Octodon degus]|uniref:Vomeronasal type-1 receptor n=1 Tax=Octodon degus TaxID=10160 RepID=A0A6P6EJB8_OCTDE|nr:vomeronasal type-1 receptor 90-like [Octodon degus]